VDLEAYVLVLLWRPEVPSEFDEATLDELQRRHLDFYRDLRERNIVAANGPFIDQPDVRLRGLALFLSDSHDEVRSIALNDPLVQAGRLAIDVMTWWCQPGALAKHGRAITVAND
jgi:uncharacterized protein